MSQNHRRDAPAINPTKNSSLFEVPYRLNQSKRRSRRASLDALADNPTQA